AGLAHQDLAGRHVPGREVALPKTVKPAGGDEGYVERGRAEAAEAGDLVLQRGHLLERELMVAAADMRQPAGDHAFIQLAAAGDAQALVVEEGALAALGDIELVIGGIVDHAGDDRAFARQPDRDRELRDAVQEIGGAVQGIDDPAMALVGAFALSAFLAEEAVAGSRLGEIAAEHLFGALVGERDEIGRSLQRNLQMFDLAEIVLEAAAGAARRLDHDIDEGGIEHCVTMSSQRLAAGRGGTSGMPGTAPGETRSGTAGAIRCGCPASAGASSWSPSQRCALRSVSARSAGLSLDSSMSRSGSYLPAVFAIRCHFSPSTLSTGTPPMPFTST